MEKAHILQLPSQAAHALCATALGADFYRAALKNHAGFFETKNILRMFYSVTLRNVALHSAPTNDERKSQIRAQNVFHRAAALCSAGGGIHPSRVAFSRRFPRGDFP